MSQLLIPREFSQQPQEAVEIDWSNPLTNALVFAAYSYSASCIDAALGSIGNNVGVVTTVVNVDGVYANYSTTDYADFSVPLLTGLTQFSIFSVSTPVADLGTGYYGPFEVGKTMASDRAANIEVSGTSEVLSLWNSAGTRTQLSGISSISTPWIAEQTRTHAITLNSTVHSGFSRIERQPPYLNSMAFSGVLRDINLVGIGRNWSALYQGRVAPLLMWRRCLSTDELLTLSDNPWQIFKAPPHVLYFDVGAVAPPPSTPIFYHHMRQQGIC